MAMFAFATSDVAVDNYEEDDDKVNDDDGNGDEGDDGPNLMVKSSSGKAIPGPAETTPLPDDCCTCSNRMASKAFRRSIAVGTAESTENAALAANSLA